MASGANPRPARIIWQARPRTADGAQPFAGAPRRAFGSTPKLYRGSRARRTQHQLAQHRSTCACPSCETHATHGAYSVILKVRRSSGRCSPGASPAIRALISCARRPRSVAATAGGRRADMRTMMEGHPRLQALACSSLAGTCAQVRPASPDRSRLVGSNPGRRELLLHTLSLNPDQSFSLNMDSSGGADDAHPFTE